MIYDCIIIGAGPAGLTCSLYLKRANKKILVFEKEAPGGKLSHLKSISNYPGIKEIDGATLAFQMYEQAVESGVEIIFEEVTSLKKQDNYYQVITSKATYEASYVVYAGGMTNNKLSIKGERDFFNKGISYCVTCDGALYKNKKIAYIYKGNHEVDYEIAYLKNLTSDLLIIDLNDPNNQIQEFNGNTKLERVTYVKNNEVIIESIDAAFINLGLSSSTDLTSDGIYTIGDAANHPLKQIVIACADGANVASEIIKNLK